MSMNFGREQALLRQRLTAAGSAAQAAEKEAKFGGGVSYLGADDGEVAAAAQDLCDTYPEMGRAQMTAFVRTLWQSKVHELRQVGVEILARRALLLEPPDLPFLETLLKDANGDPIAHRLAADVLGPLVGKNKKLWKDLKKLAQSNNERMRRAAVRAAQAPLAADGTVFERFEQLVAPLLADDDKSLQKAIDEALAAAARQAADAVRAFADEHGRKVKLPKGKAKVVPSVAAPAPAPTRKAAAKPAPAKKAAKKATARKAPAKNAPAKKPASATRRAAR